MIANQSKRHKCSGARLRELIYAIRKEVAFEDRRKENIKDSTLKIKQVL